MNCLVYTNETTESVQQRKAQLVLTMIVFLPKHTVFWGHGMIIE